MVDEEPPITAPVDIHEAKTQLFRLVGQAAQGHEFVIAKAGKPMDPFDRMLVAQAAVEGLTLLSADAGMKRYGRFVRAV